MADIELSKALHERVYERIRDSIGDLMTDEDLKKLVDAATKKAFFENVITRDRHGYVQSEQAPYFVTMVRDLLQEEVRKHVKAYFKAHPDEITTVAQKVLEQGMAAALMSAVETMFSNSMYTLRQNVMADIQRS